MDLRGTPSRRRAKTAWHGQALHGALVLVAVLSLALAGVALASTVRAGSGPVWVLVLFVAVGLEFIATGLVAFVWRPTNRIGLLLSACGITLLVADLQNGVETAPALVGLILGQLPIAVILHMLLAFPSGRLNGIVARRLVFAGYVVTVVFEAPQYLFARLPGAYGLLEITPSQELADLGRVVQHSAGAVVLVASAVLLGLRLRSATPAARLMLAALYGYGIATILFLELAANVLPPVFGIGPVTVFVLQISAFGVIPVVFSLGMLRGRFVRSGQIEELGMWLGAAEGGRPTLRDALARALGDESVELVFWLPDGGRYVDATGFSFPLPRTGSDRGVVEVESSGELVGAIIYDAVLIAEPELVRAAGRVIALALERERLTAELRASRDAVRESRARIVEAADRERRQIAQDLHDGLQGRLVLLGIQAAQLEQAGSDPEVRAAADGLRGGLEAAAAELRGLVQGVMPSLLIERGLYAATADLVDRLPVPTRLELSGGEEPLPDEVQRTGYFVVAEALTNAVKHSRARELAVCVGRVNGHLAITVRDNGIGGAALTGGSGLRGIADRLDVLGGRLRVESELGHGTVITAEVPCGL